MQQLGPVLFSIGGRFLGGMLGGPIGSVIGGLAGGLIGSLIFNRALKPLIPDVNVMSSNYGNPIPIIYGTVRLPGVAIWMDNVNVHSHGIGKGLGQLTGQNPYSYWQDAMIAFCEGPASLLKLWLDGILFLDNTTNSGELSHYTFAIRTYIGDDAQLPDFKYAAWVVINVYPPGVPAHRGIAYLFIDKIDLAHYGLRFPQMTATWTTQPTNVTNFVKLARLSPDVSSDTTPTGPLAAAVDWTRGVLYSCSTDGTLRAFDINSGTCLQAMVSPNVQGITCGNNTQLYGWGRFNLSSQGYFLDQYGHTPGFISGAGGPNILYFFTINPDSLLITSITTVEYSGITSDNIPGSLVCFGIDDPTAGVFDMIAGTWFIPTGRTAFAIRPDTQTYVEAPLDRETLFAYATCTVGYQDPNSYDTIVYFLNSDYYDPATGTIYIYSVVLAASEWSTTQIEQLFSGDGYGDGPGFNPSYATEFVPEAFEGTTVSPAGKPTLIYDPTDDTLIVMSPGWIGGPGSFKATIDEGTQIWTSTYTGGPGGNTMLGTSQLGGQDGWTTNIAVIETASGVLSGSAVAAGSPGTSSLYPAVVYNGPLNAITFFGDDGNYYIAYLQRATSSEYPVASIITDICTRVGLLDTDIDVSLVTQTVWGYAITAQKSAGAALADLCHVFSLDMVESDYTIKFIPRGQPSVATLTQDQLGSIDPQNMSKFWIMTRAQELELPLMLAVKYQDPDLDYNPGSQYASRTALPVPTVYSKRRKAMDLPAVMTATEGRTIAQTLLYTMWAERNTYKTMLSPQFLWLDPGDNITVTLDSGRTMLVRGQVEQIGADLSMMMDFCSENSTTYVTQGLQGGQSSTGPQVISAAPFGQLLLFNVPLLRDVDDTGGTAMRIYYAAGSFGSNWVGGSIWNSPTGATWSSLQQLGQAASWGYTTAVLGDTPAKFAMDYKNTVVVAFTAGSGIPENCTYQDIMNGSNAILVGYEIVQFMTVTANGNGIYTLSGLARGRRGTEWATGIHAVGETCVLLVLGVLGSNQKLLAEIGQNEQWRLVPSGRYIDEVPLRRFSYLGFDLLPYAPVNFSRATSGSDLLLQWIRRTRVGGYLMDGIDTVPLAEATESYDAFILPNAAAIRTFDPTNSATYTRAFVSLTTAQATYTAADMTADGFTPTTDTLYLAVYQISAVVGRGFQGYQALPAF